MSDKVEFFIRRAVTSDGEELVALLNDVSKETTFTNVNPEEGFWLSADEQREVIVQHEKTKNGVIIVAREKGSDLLIGDIIATRQPPASSHVFELGICVRKAYWGAGVGRALFEAATEAARDLGAERLQLGVYSHNHRAIRMYERAGFLREGLQRCSSKFGQDTYYDDILMGRFLIDETTIESNRQTIKASNPAGMKFVEFDLWPAKPEDIKEIVSLTENIDREFNIDTISSEKDCWIMEERQCISNKDAKTIYMLAKERSSGHLIGSAKAIRQLRDKNHIYIMNVSVLQDFWGDDGAVGQALLAAVVDAATAAGAEKFELNTWASNHRIVDMCRKFGFHKEALHRGAVKNNDGLYDDEVCMAYFPFKRRAKVVDFVLSEATPDDAEELIILLNDIRKETSIDPEEKFWLSAEEEREVIIEHKAKKTGQIILAREKGSNLLIGNGIAMRNPRVSSHAFELGVSVRKPYWGAGVGRALFEAATQAAEKLGAERLELVVFSHNHRAIRMYERAGYVCEGLKKWSSKTGTGIYHDDMLMARFLDKELTNKDPEEGTITTPVAKRSMDFEIVPGRPENAAEMVEYLNAISRETDFTTIDPVNGFWMTVEEEEEFIRDKTADKTAIFLNAREKSTGYLIGCATAFRQSRDMTHVFELGVSIRKEFWGAGAGRALFAAIVDASTAMGAEKLDLVVYTNNRRAIDMYRRFGFQEEAILRRAAKTYSGFYRDCMHMALFPKGRSIESMQRGSDGKDFTISLGTPSDAADWVAHLNEVAGETKFCSFDKNGYRRTVKEEEQRMREIKESGDGVYVLVRDNKTGQLIGCGSCFRIKNRRADHVFDLGLTVLREHWGRGAGTAIMERLIQETKRLGGRKIVLDFNADNTRAEKLYERMGFYVEGRLREQIMVDGRYVDLVCMAKFLH